MALTDWMVAEGKLLDLDEEFWRVEKEKLFAILFPLLTNAALAGAKSALDGLLEIGVGVDWGLVNLAVRDWAKRYTFSMVSGVTDTSRKFLQSALPEWIESGAPLDALIDQLMPMFGPVRAEMIAVTETTRSFAEGNTETWKESGVVSGRRWMTAEDELVCPICGDYDGNVYDMDDDQHTPPSHVNCRCYLQPVVEVE